MTLIRQIEASLADLPHGALVVGFSGGLDSMVLLHVLATIGAAKTRGLRALHVNHGLHADSGEWARHCRSICAHLGITINTIEIHVDPCGEGLEAAARRQRWQAFARDVDVTGEILALAHHRDDQAETVLLRLLRGAGPAGLAAMRPFSVRANGLRVWRPLLGIGRADIAAYANTFGLNWLDDPSNRELSYDRNYLRRIVMPALRDRWPETDRTLAQIAERQADAFALEKTAAATLLAHAATPNERILTLAPLRDAPRPLRWAALRAWLAHQGAPDLGATRLQRIDTELIEAAEDAEPRIDLGGCIVRRYRGALHALLPNNDTALEYRFAWDGRSPLRLPAGAGALDIAPSPREPLPLVVASRRGGERIRMHRGGPRRELKHLLQEAGVPPWQRTRWPVVWLDDEPVAFADIVIGAPLEARLEPSASTLRFMAD